MEMNKLWAVKMGKKPGSCRSVLRDIQSSCFTLIYLSFSENSRLAAEVYKDMPETSFTRTISNPEVVMKRRRQQKLEKRMQEFMSSDGRPESGILNNFIILYQRK